MNAAHMIIFLFDKVENMVRKGENASYQHFLLFPQCFKGLAKVCIVGLKVMSLYIIWKKVRLPVANNIHVYCQS